jgi:hypothetical protein
MRVASFAGKMTCADNTGHLRDESLAHVTTELELGSEMLRDAKKLIESCERCNPDGAEIPFDNILDSVSGSVFLKPSIR